MNVLKVFHYQLSSSKKALAIYYGVFLLIYFVFSIITLFASKSSHINFNINGFDFCSFIFLFAFSLNSFTSNFKIMHSNGVSRYTFYKGYLLSIFPITALVAFLNILVNKLYSSVLIDNSLYSIIYLGGKPYNYVEAPFFPNLIWSFAALSTTAILGWMLCIIYYRSNTLVKILVSTILVIQLPLLDFIFSSPAGNGFSHFLSTIFGITSGNSYIGAVTLAVIFAIFSFVSYVLIRRAPVK